MSPHICYIDKPSTANLPVKKPDAARPAAVSTQDAATSSSTSEITKASNTKDKVLKSTLAAQTEKIGDQLNAQLDASRLKGVTSGARPEDKGGAQAKVQMQLQNTKITTMKWSQPYQPAFALSPEYTGYRRARLFVMTLRYSRRCLQRVIWNLSKETWALLHQLALRYFHGTTAHVVLDILKEDVI